MAGRAAVTDPVRAVARVYWLWRCPSCGRTNFLPAPPDAMTETCATCHRQHVVISSDDTLGTLPPDDDSDDSEDDDDDGFSDDT